MKKQTTDASAGSLPPDWLVKKLAQLRAQLAEYDQWPEGANRLLQLLSRLPEASPEDKEDRQLLSLIVHDALEGVDISRQFPAFFEQMLADVSLREAFLDTLEILELNRAGQLEPLPEEPSHDLSFLHKKVAQPAIEITESGRWRIIWQQTADQIEALFNGFTLTPDVPYRGTPDWLDDHYLTLLRDTVTVGEEQYSVLLEAVQPLETPEHLQLSLLVATNWPACEETAALQARLQWGSYENTLTLDQNGRGRFAPVPLLAILDEAGEKVITDLELELMPDVFGIPQ